MKRHDFAPGRDRSERWMMAEQEVEKFKKFYPIYWQPVLAIVGYVATFILLVWCYLLISGSVMSDLLNITFIVIFLVTCLIITNMCCTLFQPILVGEAGLRARVMLFFYPTIPWDTIQTVRERRFRNLRLLDVRGSAEQPGIAVLLYLRDMKGFKEEVTRLAGPDNLLTKALNG